MKRLMRQCSLSFVITSFCFLATPARGDLIVDLESAFVAKAYFTKTVVIDVDDSHVPSILNAWQNGFRNIRVDAFEDVPSGGPAFIWKFDADYGDGPIPLPTVFTVPGLKESDLNSVVQIPNNKTEISFYLSIFEPNFDDVNILVTSDGIPVSTDPYFRFGTSSNARGSVPYHVRMTLSASAVPEPSSALILAVAAALSFWMRRKRLGVIA